MVLELWIRNRFSGRSNLISWFQAWGSFRRMRGKKKIREAMAALAAEAAEKAKANKKDGDDEPPEPPQVCSADAGCCTAHNLLKRIRATD